MLIMYFNTISITGRQDGHDLIRLQVGLCNNYCILQMFNHYACFTVKTGSVCYVCMFTFLSVDTLASLWIKACVDKDNFL